MLLSAFGLAAKFEVAVVILFNFFVGTCPLASTQRLLE